VLGRLTPEPERQRPGLVEDEVFRIGKSETRLKKRGRLLNDGHRLLPGPRELRSQNLSNGIHAARTDIARRVPMSTIANMRKRLKRTDTSEGGWRSSAYSQIKVSGAADFRTNMS
jgi:hypothetical protein